MTSMVLRFSGFDEVLVVVVEVKGDMGDGEAEAVFSSARVTRLSGQGVGQHGLAEKRP
jgi:hypothetical protein